MILYSKYAVCTFSSGKKCSKSVKKRFAYKSRQEKMA